MLLSLAGCLCAQIEADGSPQPCFCGVVPGEAAVAQYAGDCDTRDGMAWVRLTTGYPSVSVGQIDQRVGNCKSGTGFDVEVGILRAFPVEEEAPTDAELLAAFDQQMKDMLTMRRAIECCDAISSKDFILGSYRPSGPLGGLVGGIWNVMLAV